MFCVPSGIWSPRKLRAGFCELVFDLENVNSGTIQDEQKTQNRKSQQLTL